MKFNVYERSIHKTISLHFSLLRECRNILDVGCGLGLFVALAPERITGIDANPNFVALCQMRGLNVVVGDARELPFEDSVFEGLRLSHVIEHFTPDDAYRCLVECSRVLKQNGKLLIASPLASPCFFNDPSHIRPYPASAILLWVDPKPGQQNLQANVKLFEPLYYRRLRTIPPLSFLGDLAPRAPGPSRSYRILIEAIRKFLFMIGFRAIGFSEYVLVLKKI